MDEALEALDARRHPSRHAARPRLPVRRRGRRLRRRARPGLRRRAEPRRAAAHAAGQRGRASTRRGSSRSCTTTARRSPRASSSTRSPSSWRRSTGDAAQGARPNDLHRQAQAPSPQAADERARLHASRLRGLGLDALRRLRPRFDQRRDHPGLLRARPAAAPRRQALGHRLLVEDADLFPRPEPRLQQRARPHAVGADRRQPRQPRPHLSRRLRRRRLAPRSASASSPIASGAASTWSTSSRTTACTA